MFTSRWNRATRWLNSQLFSDSAYLIPLRLFIGIGWVRAGMQKLMDPGWGQGTTLFDFFSQHVTSGQVVFPFYHGLIWDVFIPNVVTLSWLILVGQILVGGAILSGTFTNFALLCGLFMNLNFILMGEVTPSAFYIVIQMILLVTNVGFILGMDAILARKIPIGLLVAQPYSARKYWRVERAIYQGVAIAMIFLGMAVIPFIRDFTPQSVDDTAMILLVLSVFTGLLAWITAIKFPQKVKRGYPSVRTDQPITRPR